MADVVGVLPAVVRGVIKDARLLGIESSFVINVEDKTVRYLGDQLDRGYGRLSPWEIPLTLDLISRRDLTEITDWKSRARVTPCADNLQMRLGGLAVRTVRGVDSVLLRLAYLDDGELDECIDDGSRDERTWYELKRAIAYALDGDEGQLHEGPWCTYCPAIASCPAKNKMVRMFSQDLDARDWERAAMELPAEQAGSIYDRIEHYEKLLDRAKRALQMRAAWEPLPVEGGRRRLKVVQVTQNRFDTTKAKRLLDEHGIEHPTKQIEFSQTKRSKA